MLVRSSHMLFSLQGLCDESTTYVHMNEAESLEPKFRLREMQEQETKMSVHHPPPKCWNVIVIQPVNDESHVTAPCSSIFRLSFFFNTPVHGLSLLTPDPCTRLRAQHAARQFWSCPIRPSHALLSIFRALCAGNIQALACQSLTMLSNNAQRLFSRP